MRSLTLSIRNINSLRGDHVVDFTDPVLAGVDLFGITGPTGSGKSTLLDAITLALYGRVVRLGAGSSPEPSVSTHAVDASVVYRFSVQGGVYEARWSMRRSRGRLDGTFLQPVRELLTFLADGSFESVAEGNTRVNAAVEELLGLGFEQFQRVALLPQGEFDRFLTSSETDRAGILEKLTGTGPYQVYGHRIHSKWVDVNEKLEKLRNWMGGVEATLLSDDARSGMEMERTRWQSEHATLSAEARGLSGRLAQATQLAEALAAAARCAGQRDELEQEIASAELEVARVRRWRELEPAYRAEATVQSAASAAIQAKQNLDQAAERLASATLGWGLLHAQVLDFGHRQVAQDLEDARGVARRHGFQSPGNIGEAVTLAEDLGGRLQQVAQLLDACVSAIAARESAAEKHWRRLRKASGSPAHASGFDTVPSDGPERQQWFDKSLGWASAQVPAVAAEAAQCKRLAESALAAAEGAKTIAALKRQLADGGRCGVCGSEVPAGRVGAIPAAGDLVEAAEEAQRAWEKSVQRSEAVPRWMEDVLAERLEWENQSKNAAMTLQSLADRVAQCQLPALPPTEESRILVQQSLGILSRVQLRARQSTVLERLAAEGPEGPPVGTFSPREWTDIESAGRDLDACKRQTTREREYSVAAAAAVEAASTALRAAEDARTVVWHDLNMVDGKDLDAFSMELRVAERVEQEARTRLDRLSRLEGQWTASVQSCDRLRKIAPPLPEDDAGRDELARRSADASASADHALAQESSLGASLSKDAENREKIVARKAELEQLEIQERRWRFLREHFGKDRLTKKVQELTMGALVGYANLRLAGFTGRYELTCDASRALEIRVRDRARLDVLRPTAGLSGGEKFLVSLSLALGLSDIASRSSRIESLFIDEGFGTLDSDTLETALATLQQLRSESGRQVGIISHVGALQERLSARIRLVPRGDGNSVVRLEGG